MSELYHLVDENGICVDYLEPKKKLRVKWDMNEDGLVDYRIASFYDDCICDMMAESNPIELDWVCPKHGHTRLGDLLNKWLNGVHI